MKYGNYERNKFLNVKVKFNAFVFLRTLLINIRY